MTVKYVGCNKEVTSTDPLTYHTSPGVSHALITCLSTDTKPTDTSFAASFGILLETDTDTLYWWNGSGWSEFVTGGTAAWGGITGTLSAQTDLQTSLDGKSATGHN